MGSWGHLLILQPPKTRLQCKFLRLLTATYQSRVACLFLCSLLALCRQAAVHGVAKSRTRLSDSTELPSVRGIFQARIPACVAISFFRGSSWPRDGAHISCISCVGRWILSHCITCVLCAAQSCPTLCDPMGPPGFSAHGILQARILEWVAVSSSSRSPQPRDQTQVSRSADDSLPAEPPGKPLNTRLPNVICTKVKHRREENTELLTEFCVRILRALP